MKKLIISLYAALAAGFAGAQSSHTLVIGTYDSPKSDGIYLYDFNSSTGFAKRISSVHTVNPSFVAVSPDKKFVYAVNENAPGQVSSFRYDAKLKQLSFIDSQSSNGNHPCYITVSKNGKWVFAGNYSSGSLAVYPVKAGQLDTAKQIIRHSGSGPDTSRQQSPHVHGTFLTADNNYLYVPDLGIDKIMTYHFSPKTGDLYPSKTGFLSVDAGAGPRHIAFHPNQKYIYLMTELAGAVYVIRDFGGADLHIIQGAESALPLTYKGPAGSADIHVSPDGKFLYCTNRGASNTIAIFSIDQKTGKITRVGHQSTLGLKPRNFNFDPTGKFLLVANQDSDEVVIFKRDLKTGLLTDTGNRITVGKPVCLQWIN